MKVFDSGAKKDYEGKAMFELIPPEVIKSYAAVLTFGVNKKGHGSRNWEKGLPYSVCVGALMRHLNAFIGGQKINVDDEGLGHLEHAAWWINALITYEARNRNDLPAYLP
jgi:hypothetical protein